MGPPRANNANPPTPIKLQKLPGTTTRSPSPPTLPSLISSRFHLGHGLSECRYPSPGPPNRASSKPGTRGTSQAKAAHQQGRAGHPTAPETLPPPYLPARTVKQRNAAQAHTDNSTNSVTATTPKMEPLFVTSRLARLSPARCRLPWVLTAATRSSSTTCRR